jgi:hypothetical protein
LIGTGGIIGNRWNGVLPCETTGIFLIPGAITPKSPCDDVGSRQKFEITAANHNPMCIPLQAQGATSTAASSDFVKTI